VVLERKKATERKLQEIVSLHQLVSENSRDVIVVADFDGNRSFVSAAARVWGWKPEDVIAFTGLQLVHPDDLHKAKAAVGDYVPAATAPWLSAVSERLMESISGWKQPCD